MDYKHTKETVAKNFYIARNCRGLKHTDLVKISKITRPVISGIENGKANPTFDTLLQLSKCLGIGINMMFLSKSKFSNLFVLLKQNLTNSKMSGFEIYIPERIWNELISCSLNIEKRNYKKIIGCCRRVVEINFRDEPDIKKLRMTYSAVQGIIYQDDGFYKGLEFGIWLYIHLFDKE